ncbi:MAG: hypothetical protein KF904_09890 [Rhodoblastus sp.]|nr:hypothetical protein [Rhodoblastus sp.]
MARWPAPSARRWAHRADLLFDDFAVHRLATSTAGASRSISRVIDQSSVIDSLSGSALMKSRPLAFDGAYSLALTARPIRRRD